MLKRGRSSYNKHLNDVACRCGNGFNEIKRMIFFDNGTLSKKKQLLSNFENTKAVAIHYTRNLFNLGVREGRNIPCIAGLRAAVDGK